MIRPLVGCSKPAIIRSVVVLPQPDGPSRVKNSPAGMSTLMPATATCSPKAFVSSSSWISPDIQTSMVASDVASSPPAKRRYTRKAANRVRSVIASPTVAMAFSAGVGAPRALE